jgi:hypothetical protein
VLRAYFDESGIHAGSPVTVLSGFIGSRNQWKRVTRKWEAVMKGEVFHYKNMRLDGVRLQKLASILCDSGLEVIAGGFSGNWERAINSGAPDWPTRFPSCYHMILEMCVQHMYLYSKEYWNGEPAVLTFSRQDQYAKRAEEIWRTYKGNGLWDHIVGFGYGDPALRELQAADMIAHETFQCLKQGGDDAWGNWPLVRKLLEADRGMRGRHQTEEQFVKMMREQDRDRIYLKTIDRPHSKRT